MASPKGKKEASRALALGALARKLRRDRKLTQVQVAERIPMSVSNLSRIELGSQGPPEVETIERMAAALGTDPGELLRAAGRAAGGEFFEDAVLDKLNTLGRELREVKEAVVRERG